MPPQPPVTLRHVLITLAIFVAAFGVVALFFLPLTHPWFWPTAAIVGIAIATGYLIPLPRRPG